MENEKEQIGEVLVLRAQDTPIQVIAERTGMSVQEVIDTIAQNRSVLGNLKGIRDEMLLAEYGVTKADRLSKLATLKNKLQEELERRTLDDVPTEKLLTLLLKLNDAIRDEAVVPTITPSWRADGE